jgi:peptidoglycan/xylan/chitin deacetylase (PgdA/CDA1 family)
MSLRLILSVTCFALPATALAENCSSLGQLEWLLGHWKSAGENTVIAETWERISDKTFEGFGESRSAINGELKSRETLRLVQMSGAVFFIAKVAHNEFPVGFRLTDCEDGRAVFENTVHDFPTRIGYQRLDADSMTVDVSGADGNGFQLGFQRMNEVPARRIAITFDDAPRAGSTKLTGAERTALLIRNLEAAQSPPVIFFSTAANIDEAGDVRMRQYQDAGHYIGNHSYSHPGLEPGKADEYLEDVRRAHGLLSQYPNFVPMFRYPFLNEGRDRKSRDSVRSALGELGYRNGYVTVDNYDFYMDTLLQRALENGREADYRKLGRLYVETLVDAADFYDDIAQEVLGRSPAHVLLLHENDLAALYIGDLIAGLRDEGWEIIDAMAAYDDPIAAVTPDTLFNNQGRVAAIAETGGMDRRDLVHPAEDREYLERLFEERGVFDKQHAWKPGDSGLLLEVDPILWTAWLHFVLSGFGKI